MSLHKGFKETDIHSYSTVSLMDMEGSPNSWANSSDSGFPVSMEECRIFAMDKKRKPFFSNLRL
jgi:hypothetical protein